MSRDRVKGGRTIADAVEAALLLRRDDGLDRLVGHLPQLRLAGLALGDACSSSDLVSCVEARRTVAEVDQVLRAQQAAQLLGAKGRRAFDGHGLCRR